MENIQVLFSRGDGCYIIQKDNLFYLINLGCEDIPIVKKHPDSFLKFGYFREVTEIDEKELHAIESKLPKSCSKMCYNPQ